MDQTTKLRCWNCKDIFHMVIRGRDYRAANLVSKTVPCPYCDSHCKVEIHESQVPTVSVHRRVRGETPQTEEIPWGELLEPGALVNQVFPSASPDDIG